MEKKPKICVYAICKNESKFVDRWVGSLYEADCIVVMDTGSTDNTVELLQRYSPFVTVEQKIIEPWRFDTARNESMKMIPEDTDICVVSDLDQVFRPGWADELRRLYLEGYEEVYGPIIDYDDATGKQEKEFLSKNVHPNDKAWYWERPIHEGVLYHGEKEVKAITSENFVIEHHPDKSKSRASYLGLLEKEYEENSEDLLCSIYYSCELYFHGRIYEALEVMLKSLEKCDFNTDPTYGYIMYVNIANLLMEVDKAEEALEYIEKAHKFGVKTRNLYMTHAKVLSLLGRYEDAIDYIYEALTVKENIKSWIEEDKYFKGYEYDELSMMYYHCKDYIKATAFALLAIHEGIAEFERVDNNINFFLQDILNVYYGENTDLKDRTLIDVTVKSFRSRAETLLGNGDAVGALGLIELAMRLDGYNNDRNQIVIDERYKYIVNLLNYIDEITTRVEDKNHRTYDYDAIQKALNSDKVQELLPKGNFIGEIKHPDDITIMEEKNTMTTPITNKVCVYAICKNEAQFVDKWIESMKEADLIVVVDTGSTDDTVEKLKSYETRDDVNIRVYQEIFNPWRFDVARNKALDLVPEEYNILVSTDLDEILEPGWGDILRKRWIEGQHIRGNYKYSWSHLPNGESGRVFVYDKIHSREWRWKYPVHELLFSERLQSENYPQENVLYLFDDIHLHHYPDQTKSRGSYLGLLELRAQEDPDDYYGLIYLAHEYYYQSQYENSIATLNRVIDRHANRYTSLELASCYLFMGDSYFALKENSKAMDSYLKAINIEPSYREPYLDLAKVLLEEKEYVIAQHFISTCLSVTYRHYTWLERDTSWTHEPYDLMSLALFYGGKKVQSLSYAVKAYGYDTTNERLRENVNVILDCISDEEWAKPN